MSDDLVSIWDSLKAGDSKHNPLYSILSKFFTRNRYCSKVIGRGSFGSIQDRSKILTHITDTAFGKPIFFPNLVAKEVNFRSKTTPLYPDQKYPFYFCIRKDNDQTVVDTDNRQNVGGFANEMIANLLATELFKKVSPHFVYMADFSICESHIEYYFENIGFDFEWSDGGVTNISNIYDHLSMWQQENVELSDDAISGLLFSILHSLYLLRLNFNFSHFDLHMGNIYVKVLTPDKYFAGENLMKYKYFAYHVDDKIYYTRNVGYIIKIGDLGWSKFTLGKTRFDNAMARMMHRPEMYVPYCNQYKEYPDYVRFFANFIPRFSRKFKAIEKIKETVYPFNNLNGMLPLEILESDPTFQPMKIPTLKDVIKNLGIFDHLLKPPKAAESRILHVFDTKIVDSLGK